MDITFIMFVILVPLCVIVMLILAIWAFYCVIDLFITTVKERICKGKDRRERKRKRRDNK